MPLTDLPVVVVLAAGRGERFAASGGTVPKLQAMLGGRRIIDHVLDAVRLSGLPHHVVLADAALPGMGDSIAAGVRATAGASAWLILPADLPLIRPETLRAVAFAPACAVVVPRYRGQAGHPVRFAAACGPQLTNLKGNRGAAQIVAAQAAINCVAYIDVDDIGCVTDIDTTDDLHRAESLLAQRADGKA